jgi:sugar phosphate permease
MSRTILTLILCLHLLMPAAAWAQSALKTPLSYSLREYGLILGIALLGGVVSWYSKVRKGELLMWNISALIGELAVSAFAGLLAFWLCEWMNFHPLLTPAIVGMSGHAGAKGLSWMESVGQRVVEKRLGIDTTVPTKEPPA